MKQLTQITALVLVVTFVCAFPATAEHRNPKPRPDQIPYALLERAIGHNWQEIHACLDDQFDLAAEDECAEVLGFTQGSIIAGSAFAIFAILKFKAHCDNPTADITCQALAAFLECVKTSGNTPIQCWGMLDRRLEDLADRLIAFRALDAICGDTKAECPPLPDWPRAWPWPY